ncbi:MAG: hypothetical protein AB1758_37075 [Candidatus Eremiobacterota bacterium]
MAAVVESSELDLSPFNITVIGRFNAHIVEPNWCAGVRIIPPGDFNVFMPVGGVSPVYQLHTGLGWIVQADRLMVFGNKAEAPQFLADLLNSLPHTPVTAAGVNFQRKMQAAFRPTDHACSLSQICSEEPVESSESRTYLIEDSVKLTLKVTWTRTARTTDANFHVDGDREVIARHAGRIEEFERILKDMEARIKC